MNSQYSSGSEGGDGISNLNLKLKNKWDNNKGCQQGQLMMMFIAGA
jgi:hypothetical protein